MASDISRSQKRIWLDNLDRLSTLPKEIINEILKRVPIKDVVRTSILSKEWISRWKHVSNLVFDGFSLQAQIVPMVGQVRDPFFIAMARDTKLAHIIHKVLQHHQGMVSRFEAHCGPWHYGYDVNGYISCLQSKCVEEFVLDFWGGIPYMVPSSLFNFQNLRVLKLGSCVLTLPSDLRGFNQLTVLDLCGVEMENDTITKFQTNNPLLEQLKLYHCSGFAVLSIFAPKLTIFSFDGCCHDIFFKNTSNLKKAHLGIKGLSPTYEKNRRLEDVLAGFINVDSLHVHKLYMEILASCIIPERLHVTYDHLKHLEMHMNLEDSAENLVALCLFRSSPCLQEIKLSYSSENMGSHSDQMFWEAHQHGEENFFPKLTTVLLFRFKGMKCELGFIEFLLTKAVVLQTLNLKWASNVTGDQRLLAAQKMLEFQIQRASTRARLVFVE